MRMLLTIYVRRFKSVMAGTIG